ncbi:hypothetical protein B0A54_11822 [Friedmanniomyces endolithicus]|uniref:Uncharacterized protein n=2 Tax=Dothideomycetidae TaxID=451867 RepID=A0A4V5N6N5_9PEZI|nr:hypothetical protein B0A54_11822 [Friedmanniomyces endolithicus]
MAPSGGATTALVSPRGLQRAPGSGAETNSKRQVHEAPSFSEAAEPLQPSRPVAREPHVSHFSHQKPGLASWTSSHPDAMALLTPESGSAGKDDVDSATESSQNHPFPGHTGVLPTSDEILESPTKRPSQRRVAEEKVDEDVRQAANILMMMAKSGEKWEK